MRVLTIDLGGTYVKVMASGAAEPRRVESGKAMGPTGMVAAVRQLVGDWQYDAITFGYPGVVRDNRPVLDPNNLAPGWVAFDYERALDRPVRIINDAAMQALGSYEGGRMLFLGLGTGLGSALVIDKVVHGMELSQLPYKEGRRFGDFLARRGLERLGMAGWQQAVAEAVPLLQHALCAEYVVLGGGNVRHLDRLPPHTRIGANANAFRGGFRLWLDPEVRV
jgi:polyphosphate glucokinase